MKKLGIALAAAAAIVLAAAPMTQAVSKTLWEGWMEEVQKARTGATAPAAAKKK
jgi:hypothetical protein